MGATGWDDRDAFRCDPDESCGAADEEKRSHPIWDPEDEERDEDEGYAPYDPKHPTYNARRSDLWDLRDKNA